MAAIKSYTDLEQSKKLAEILPLESADMYYPNRTDVMYQGALPIEFKYGNPLLSQEIAAWSLAALLNIIGHYTLQTVSDSKRVIVVSENGNPISSFSNHQPVDACYEMILKLHELKLL